MFLLNDFSGKIQKRHMEKYKVLRANTDIIKRSPKPYMIYLLNKETHK